MNLLNLTPHAIVLVDLDGNITTIQPSGIVARVSTIDTKTGDFNGIPVYSRTFGDVQGLPTDGTPCIVSSMVLAAIPAGTPGVYAPDTGSTAIRNDAGHILAVTRLIAA